MQTLDDKIDELEAQYLREYLEGEDFTEHLVESICGLTTAEKKELQNNFLLNPAGEFSYLMTKFYNSVYDALDKYLSPACKERAEENAAEELALDRANDKAEAIAAQRYRDE